MKNWGSTKPILLLVINYIYKNEKFVFMNNKHLNNAVNTVQLLCLDQISEVYSDIFIGFAFAF